MDGHADADQSLLHMYSRMLGVDFDDLFGPEGCYVAGEDSSDDEGGDYDLESGKLTDSLYEGCETSLVHMIFFLLSLKKHHNIDKTALDSIIHYISTHVLPKGHILPPSLHMCKKVLKVGTWRDKARHVCSNPNCDGFLFDHIAVKDWDKHGHDTCPQCLTPRFKMEDINKDIAEWSHGR